MTIKIAQKAFKMIECKVKEKKREKKQKKMKIKKNSVIDQDEHFHEQFFYLKEDEALKK